MQSFERKARELKDGKGHALEQEDGLVQQSLLARDQEWSKKAGLLPSFGHRMLVKRSMIGTEAACHIKISSLSLSLSRLFQLYVVLI